MNQTQNIRNFFETNCPLSSEGIDELLVSFKRKTISKKNLIFNEGQYEKKIRFLNSGIIREYYVNDVKESNINFYVKPMFVSDFNSFINQFPTKINQETLSDVEILGLSKDKFYQLLEKYTCGKNIIDIAFQKLLKAKEIFEYNRITKEPKKVYEEIIQYNPDWLQLIPQYHIASYLGITPETLSRIRNRRS